MKFILISGSIILPLIMFMSVKYLFKLKYLYNYLAIFFGLLFGNISSISIYTIIKEHNVFTAAIHGVFLNPLFLMSGAYLGVYGLYRLLITLNN